MAPQTGTQAIDRAAKLLTLVVQAGEPRSFTSLADEADLAKSTTSRLLQALERHHLVHRDRDGAYRPGPLFTHYAAQHDPIDDLVHLAEPTLQRLGDALGETINLSVPRGEAVVQVAQVDATYRLGTADWMGVETPPHCTSLGKVFYAYGTLPLPSGRLERRTPRTLATRRALERDLEQVRHQGYAVAREELESGLVAVGAPIHGRDASAIAAVSVSGPTARMNGRTDEVGRLLVAETNVISRVLARKARKAIA